MEQFTELTLNLLPHQCFCNNLVVSYREDPIGPIDEMQHWLLLTLNESKQFTEGVGDTSNKQKTLSHTELLQKKPSLNKREKLQCYKPALFFNHT